jgi:hypothetical protein
MVIRGEEPLRAVVVDLAVYVEAVQVDIADVAVETITQAQEVQEVQVPH